MKWLIIFSLLLPFQQPGYVVVNIQGKAVLQSKDTTIAIKPGMRISPDAKLHCISPYTVIRLAGNGGTFLITKKSDPRQNDPKSSTFWSIVKTELLPTRTTGRMASRTGVISNSLQLQQEFEKYADSSNAMLVVNTRLLQLSRTFPADTANSYFYISFDHKGEKINKKIHWKKYGEHLNLVFDKSLLTIDGKETGSNKILNAEMYFYNGKTKESTLYSDFNLAWYAAKDYKEEICLVAESIGIKDKFDNASNDQKEQLLTYVNAYFGKVDFETFSSQYSTTISCNTK